MKTIELIETTGAEVDSVEVSTKRWVEGIRTLLNHRSLSRKSEA
ncbi:MAG: hypothetical protein VKL39_08145 [Leptolyngbyaceae bacterium]|nr:hypothetical protein [Leptolyngbyaceae bacterium]